MVIIITSRYHDSKLCEDLNTLLEVRKCQSRTTRPYFKNLTPALAFTGALSSRLRVSLMELSALWLRCPNALRKDSIQH